MNCKEASHGEVAAHLSIEALRDRYVSSADVMEARHFQTIWLLAKGHGVGDVSEMTSFGQRWIEQLVARYNAEGPDALGDLRRRNGSTARVLTPEVLAKLGFACNKRPTTAGCGRAPRSLHPKNSSRYVFDGMRIMHYQSHDAQSCPLSPSPDG